MKVAAVFLVLLGIVAAGAAAVFVRTLPMFKGREVLTVDVLVAQTGLPARTRLTEENVKVQKAPPAGLPVGYFSNPAQAIGKVLKVEVAKGEVLFQGVCIVKGSVDDLLRPGMLAFAAPLSRQSTPVDLLYPGCVVDVFATFPLRDRAKGDAVVTPLLQNIQVLALGTDTVVPATQEGDKKGVMGTGLRPPSTGNVTVTLEVTARQAAALQLVLQQGRLGLAMRNPTYKGLNPMEPMIVKEGRLIAGSEALDPSTLALVGELQRLLNGLPPTADANKPASGEAKPAADPNSKPAPSAAAPPTPESIGGFQKQKSTWQTTIIRGGQKPQEVELEVNEETEQAIQGETQEGGG